MNIKSEYKKLLSCIELTSIKKVVSKMKYNTINIYRRKKGN